MMYPESQQNVPEPFYKPPNSSNKVVVIAIAVVIVLLILIFLYLVVAPLLLGPAIGNIFSNVVNTL